jgi:antitoxin component YwqK of YwqJK toxin-antitoxin module
MEEITYYNPPIKTKCNLIDGKRHGLMTEYDFFGRVTKVCTYKNGELNGTCIEFNVEGSKINGYIKSMYKCNKREGWKYYYSFSIPICTIDFYHMSDDDNDGDNITFNLYSEKNVVERYCEAKEFYEDDNLNGKRYEYLKNAGEIMKEYNYDNGKMNGWQYEYTSTFGSAENIRYLEKKYFYCDGIREGESYEYFPKNRISRISWYKNNVETGEVITYDTQGNIKSRYFKYKGKQDGECYFSEIDTIIGIGHTQNKINGKQNGCLIIRNENRNVDVSSQMKYGFMNYIKMYFINSNTYGDKIVKTMLGFVITSQLIKSNIESERIIDSTQKEIEKIVFIRGRIIGKYPVCFSDIKHSSFLFRDDYKREKGMICCICRGNNNLKILGCKHTFHLKCLLEWFKGIQMKDCCCPYCQCQIIWNDAKNIVK